MPIAHGPSDARPGVGAPAPETYSSPPARTEGTPGGKGGGGQFRALLQRADKPFRLRIPLRQKAGPREEEPPPILRNVGQWFRPETPAGPFKVKAPFNIQPHHRVLVTSAASAPQARIEISGGKLAGSQIHLSAVGQRIEAQLLTGNEATRQTLVAAMHAVRERLRLRGVLVVGTADVPSGLSDEGSANASANRSDAPREGRVHRGSAEAGARTRFDGGIR